MFVKILKTIALSLFVMAVITTPGAVVNTYFAKGLNPALYKMVLYYFLSCAFFIAGHVRQKKEYKASWIFALIIALLFFVFSAFVSGLNTDNEKFEKQNGIWTFKKGQKVEDCFGNRECKTYQINHFGLRATPGFRPGESEKNVALLGDSFIFGSGVNDGQTVASQLNKIYSKNKQNIGVINAGMAGFSLPSMVKLAEAVKGYHKPDAFVLYLKDDDISEVDTSTRIEDMQNSFTGRLLTGMNLELALEIIRLNRENENSDYIFEDDLNRLKDIAGNKLFVVTLLSGEHFNRFSSWIGNNAEIGWLDGRLSSEWQQAEIIEGDGHWNEEGSARIAGVLSGYIRGILNDKVYRSKVVKLNDLHEQKAEKVLKSPWKRLDLSKLSSKRFVLNYHVSPDNPRSFDLELTDKDKTKLNLRVYWCNESGYLEKFSAVCFSLNPAYEYQENQIGWVKELIQENENALENLSNAYMGSK